MNSFDKKTCIISGANRGIGFELTSQLLAQGATVYAGVRTLAKAGDLRGLEKNAPGRLFIYVLDVSSDSSVSEFASHVQLSQLDCLINNAGIYVDGEAPFEKVPSEKFLESFNVNTIGPVRMVRAFLPLLRKAKASRIANISSTMGSISDASGGAVGYRMSKTALNMFTKCLAQDHREVISLCLHPGWVQTEMGGKNATVKPQESAKGLLKVLAEATSKDSGHFLRFDGVEALW